MSESIPSEVEKVIAPYLPVLERMGINKSNTLLSGIARMKKYGVESYSERIIYKNGYSSIFCTSVPWAKMNKDEKFYECYKNHLSPELVRIFQNKTTLVSRSKDRTSTPFLKVLEEGGMNNSVIIHEFHDDKIKLTYFTGASDDPEARDLIISNLECLNWIKQHFQPALQDIFLSNEFRVKRELILNSSAREFIWHRSSKDKKENILSFPIKYSNITLKELECLRYLRFGASNQIIANNLNISIETVKYHLSNLKQKLSLTSRNELIKIAQIPSITNISKFIEEL